ncbi:hypothetical protein [Saccharothrix sp. HUAS TT1]|uniref:hypothetical protein n=1 Tax=unclassified Saccharothrix TaxID=2593673 RepID=UPI00345C5482
MSGEYQLCGAGIGAGAIELPDTGQTCCWGVVNDGPAGCTCWDPVHDLDQQPPDPQAVALLAAGLPPATRDGMCGDCAYRPDSPEKNSDPTYRGDPEFLERIAHDGDRFWCHDGMRRTVRLRHPSGMEIDAHPGAYDPPIVDGVPYRADGQPARLCAGWAARRRAVLTRIARETADDPGLTAEQKKEVVAS